eukprot:TRINITY_DN2542_c1_g1_i3.p1 TRINITY_DN2542_c1_g1~~TRINITY_DN2542_c1_g1_i3.p1  ORF type:complete len:1238 (+),score=329.18 TRINITY_DN2542_c1_g1_i3:40-3714(+)
MPDNQQNRLIILGMVFLYALYNLSDNIHVEKILRPHSSRCVNYIEVYPGKLFISNSTWAPRKCILKSFTNEETARCTGFVPLLTIGDAISEQISRQIVDVLRVETKQPYITIANASTVRHMEVISTRVPLPNATDPQTKFLTQKAKFIMISSGLWDFGVHFCGVRSYYEAIIERIKEIKSLALPDATVAVMNLQYFHPENCHEGTWCRSCVTPERISVYREALQLAAACTKTKMLDMTPITKQGKLATHDGVHYSPEVLIPESTILLNTMCGKFALWDPPADCSSEEDYLDKWDANIAVRTFPDGCPDYTNKHGCPNDNGKAAAKYHKRKQQEAEAEEEARQMEFKEPCTSNADIFPGKLLPTRHQWSPTDCRLRRYTTKEAVQCLKERPFLSIGDSLGEQVFWHFMDLMKTVDPYSTRYNGTVRHLVERSTRFPFPVFDSHLKFLMNKAHMVAISSGLWDFGIHFCGPMAFYRALKERVLKYRSLLKKGAIIALHNIHDFFPMRCEAGSWCRQCNSKEKIAVFREAVQLVSACTGVGMIDTFGITEQGEQYTFDGTHYFREVVEPKANLVLNIMCAKGDEGLELWYPDLPCDERAASLRWANVAEAHTAGEGCPEDANQFGCPNDEGDSLEKYEIRNSVIKARDQVFATQRNKPLCKSNAEIYPGHLSDAESWIADSCRLRHFKTSEIVSCLYERPFLSIGDSIGEQLMMFLLSKIHTAEPTVSRYNSKSRHLVLQSTRDQFPKVTNDHIKYLVNDAMMIVISAGMWDFGVHSCGPTVFYEALKERVLKVKSLKQQNAKLAILNVQAFFPDKCDHDEWCRTCNQIPRVKVYRQIVQLVAACTGVGMIDHFGITMGGVKYSSDGVHWGNGVIAPKADVILNAMCHEDDSENLKLWESPLQCEEDRYLAQWEQMPEATEWPEGCPNDNQYGCPEKIDETANLPACQKNTDIYPGKLVRGKWVPDNCVMKHWQNKEIVKCLTAKPYLSIGDSLGDQIQLHLLAALHSDDPGLSRYDSDSRQLDAHSTRIALPDTKEDHMHYLANEAMIVTISYGLWDFGIHFCSPAVFYDSLKERVEYVKSLMQPGARLALLNLHYFHPDRCEQGEWCNTCSVIPKIEVFREVIQLVSVCTGVGMVDAYGITKQAKMYTSDGVHFDPTIIGSKVDILLNAMCPDESSAMELFHPQMDCDENFYKLRWADEPLANTWSEGCPSMSNPHGCPDEDSEK